MSLEIDKINIKDLSPAEYNPRKIRDEEFASLTRSMGEFGLVDPIIVNLDNNRIIGGHQRYEVLFSQDEDLELDLIRLGNIGWAFLDGGLVVKDEAHEKALNLALNRIRGEFDIGKLNPILEELEEFNLDHLTGFDIELEEIDYDFISSPVEDIEEEGEDNSFVENIEPIKKDIIDEPINHDYTEKEHFIEKGDIYKIGNNIILYGEYNNDNIDKILESYHNENLHFKELIKGDTMKVPLKYYIIESIDLVEKLIRKNYKYSDKIN